MADTYLRPLKDVDTIFAVSHKSRETFRAIVTDLGQVDTLGLDTHIQLAYHYCGSIHPPNSGPRPWGCGPLPCVKQKHDQVHMGSAYLGNSVAYS